MSEASIPKSTSETQPKVASEEETPQAISEEPPARKEPEAEQAAKPKKTKKTKKAKKAKPVTAKVLRAAARSTADIKDIVAAEARFRKKKSNEQSSVFALAQEMHESGMGKVEAQASAAQPKVKPKAKIDEGKTGPLPVRAAQALSPGQGASRAALTAAAQTASTAPPATAATPARASRTPQVAPSAAGLPALTSMPMVPIEPSIAVPCAMIALAVSTFAAGLMIAWSVHDQSNALRALAEHPAEPSPSLPRPESLPELPRSSRANPSTGTLAAVGAGRVVYTDDSGRLIVLRRDPTSAELEVERVYELVHDEGRGQGQPNRRYHGYYLDDIEGLRRDAIEAARSRYEAAVTHSARTYKDVDKADTAAIALVAVGGADRLTQFLGPEATALRRRTAVVGLAEGGYLCAVEPLLGLLQDHIRNPRFFARLTGFASRLTSQELDPSDPQMVLSAVRTWIATNTSRNPFARVKGS